MSTEKNIIEGNKLIAAFMGAQWKYDKTVRKKYSWFFPSGNLPAKETAQWYITEYLQYDSNWNWLMQVVEKIEQQESINVSIDYKRCMIFGEHEAPPYISRGSLDNKIEAVWLAVVEFCKWHKEQQEGKQ